MSVNAKKILIIRANGKFFFNFNICKITFSDKDIPTIKSIRKRQICQCYLACYLFIVSVYFSL